MNRVLSKVCRSVACSVCSVNKNAVWVGTCTKASFLTPCHVKLCSVHDLLASDVTTNHSRVVAGAGLGAEQLCVIALLRLMATWLWQCPAAVAAFLATGNTFSSIADFAATQCVPKICFCCATDCVCLTLTQLC